LKRANNYLCNRNLRKISSAMQDYLADNDDRFPFAYERAGYSTNDINLKNGYAYTWQWQLQRYTGDWAAFRCPAADPAECALTSDGTTIEASSYGMLDAYSGVSSSTIQLPDQKVVIGETSKGGANGTYDPKPLMVDGKVLVDDGFMVGFDNDQDYPNASTGLATRLAFPDSAKLGFNRDTEGRHPDGIHYLTAGGGLRSGDASTARVILRSGSFGMWDVPKPVPLSLPKPLRP
ncbi:MAG: hypothetical protein ACHQ50_06415, partial [Fimbriimonadales bacterium]